jgi:putative nucleotidyltransferase with HDIG domain
MERSVLIDELRRLPLHQTSVVRVLSVLDDPNRGAADVAAAVSPDAGLCARLLRFANSAYFAASGRVGSVEGAVVTLGSSVVRALAISAAAGLLGDSSNVPDRFWAHSGSVAIGAALVSRQAGVSPADALSAGLLHDLGAAIAYRHDASVYGVVAPAGEYDVLAAERERFGADHCELAAVALEAWNIPPSLVDAVRLHHAPIDAVEAPLGRAVVAGEALVRVTLGDEGFVAAEPCDDPEGALAAVGIDDAGVAQLASRLDEQGGEFGAMMAAA